MKVDDVNKNMAPKVPVFIAKSDFPLKHRTFMVAEDFTLGRFQLMIRRKCLAKPLGDETAVFMMVHTGDTKKPLALCSTAETIGTVHADYKNTKGVLELDIMGENTFGGAGRKL